VFSSYILVLKCRHTVASNRFAVIVLKSIFIDLGGIKCKKMGYVGRSCQKHQESGVFGVPGSDWLKHPQITSPKELTKFLGKPSLRQALRADSRE